MLQLNYFCLLGTGNIEVSVKLTVFGDHQTTDRKAGAVTENRSICKLIIVLFSKVVNTRLVERLFISHYGKEADWSDSTFHSGYPLARVPVT